MANNKSKSFGQIVIHLPCHMVVGYFNFCTQCGRAMIMDDCDPVDVPDDIRDAIWDGFGFIPLELMGEGLLVYTTWKAINFDDSKGCDH